MNKENIKLYIEQEKALLETTQAIKVKRDALEKELEPLLTLKTEQETKLAELKLPIVEEAEKEFKANGEKKLYGGVGIKETTVVTYDKVKAEEWAKEKKLFMEFDRKAFEKAATSLNLDWVTTKKEPTVTFPKEWKLED